VRPGPSRSPAALQRALQRALPFARVSVSESFLDGELEAEVCVPGAARERQMRLAAARAQRAPAALALLAKACALASVLSWVAAASTGLARAAARQ